MRNFLQLSVYSYIQISLYRVVMVEKDAIEEMAAIFQQFPSILEYNMEYNMKSQRFRTNQIIGWGEKHNAHSCRRG